MANQFVIRNGFITLDDSQVSSSVSSLSGYVSGFGGTGTEIDYFNNSIETTDLTVRGRMRVYELLINQLRATNGSVWISSTGEVDSIQSNFTSSVDLQNGLVRHYTFDDASNLGKDSSVFNATATVGGSATYSSSGAINGSYFHSSSANSYYFTSSGIKFNTGSKFTISSWVNIHSHNNTLSHGIVMLGSFGESYGISKVSNNFEVGVRGSNSRTVVLSSDVTSLLNTWQHLTLTYDNESIGSEIKGYLNGVYVGSIAMTGTDFLPPEENYSVLNSAPIGGNTQPIVNASADDVRIYNRALKPEEIQTLYNIGTLSKYPSQGLVAHYTFNENNASTALDWTGNGYTGSILNGATVVSSTIGRALNTSGSFNRDMTTTITSSVFTGQFSVATWIYNYGYISNGSVGNILFGYGSDVAQGGQYAHWVDSSNNLQFWINGSGYNTSQVLTTNTWKHVVSTVDPIAGQVKTYLDGNLIDTRNISFTLSSSFTFNIANQSSNDVRHLNAQYEDLKVYNRILSADEISVMYNNRGGILLKTPEGTNHGFLEGDLTRAQRFTGNGVYRSDMTVTWVKNLQEWYVEPNNLLNPTLELPRQGYEYVRIGNLYDTTRRGAVYLTADDNGAPFIDTIDGINTFAKFNTTGTTKTRTGKLTGITSTVFGALDGYGFYASGSAYLEGSINATSGKIANVTITSEKLHTGNGNYGESNTPFFVSSSGFFSLGDKLTWNGTTLNITGTLVASTGSIAGFQLDSGNLWAGNAVLGNSATNVVISSVNSKIALGGTANTIGKTSASGIFLSGSGEFNLAYDANNFIRRDATTFTIKATTFDLLVGNTLNITSTVGGLIALGGTGTTYDLSNVAFSGSGIGKFGVININGNTGGSIFSGNTTLTTGTGIFLSGSGEVLFGSATGHRISYVGTTLTLSASNAILKGNTVEISGSNFHLLNGNITASNVWLSGNITASAGLIGGFTIGATSLSATNFTLDTSDKRITLGTGNNIVITDADEGFWVGNASRTSAPFSVGLNGTMTASAGNIAKWVINTGSIYFITGSTVVSMVSDNNTSITELAATQIIPRGFHFYRLDADTPVGSIKYGGIGRLHALNELSTFTDDYGFELAKITGAWTYRHIMRVGGSSAMIFGSYFDEANLWMGNATLGSTSTNIVLSTANGGKLAMAPSGTASNAITLSSTTGILLSSSGEFNFSRNANNYIRGSGTTIDIKSTVFNLSASSTLILESSTPKFALGASANTQTLSVGTGVFLNGSGHFKAGNATGQRLVFDGTNILLSASNAVITGSSGWFGASNVIQWSGTTVRIAGFYLDGNHLWGGNATLGNAGTTVVLDSTVQKIALGATADNITKTSASGIFLSGSGEFNFAYDANNYIRRDGTTFSIRATNAIISGSSVNIGAEAFNLKAGNLYIVGNGASSYIRLGSLTSTDPNTTNTGSYFDNAGSFLFKAGTTANTNFLRFLNGTMTINSTAFDLVVGNTLSVSSATGGLITLGGTGATYALSNVAFSGSGIGKFGVINIDGNTGGRIYTGTGTFNNSNTPLFMSGSGIFSLGNKMTWNGTSLSIDGVLTASAGLIGGWNIIPNALSSSVSGVRLSAGSSFLTTDFYGLRVSDQVYFGIGTQDSINFNSYFRVGNASTRFIDWNQSTLQIKSDNFELTTTGQITASAGLIGGFTISSTSLSATNFTLDTSGKRITLGTGNNIVISDADEGLWVGHATRTSAPFSVGLNGTLTASAGLIGGWFIFSNVITSPDSVITLDSVNKLIVVQDDIGPNDAVRIGRLDVNNTGIVLLDGFANEVFRVDSNGATIAGWNFDTEKFLGTVNNQEAIRLQPTIYTDPTPVIIDDQMTEQDKTFTENSGRGLIMSDASFVYFSHSAVNVFGNSMGTNGYNRTELYSSFGLSTKIQMFDVDNFTITVLAPTGGITNKDTGFALKVEYQEFGSGTWKNFPLSNVRFEDATTDTVTKMYTHQFSGSIFFYFRIASLSVGTTASVKISNFATSNINFNMPFNGAKIRYSVRTATDAEKLRDVGAGQYISGETLYLKQIPQLFAKWNSTEVGTVIDPQRITANVLKAKYLLSLDLDNFPKSVAEVDIGDVYISGSALHVRTV